MEKIKGYFHDIEVLDKVEEVPLQKFKWIPDKNGYLLIRVNYKDKLIEIGFCLNTHKLIKKISGGNIKDIYFTIAQEKWLSREDHYAYLGRELEKAYLALKYNLKYVQDLDLDLKTKDL